MPPWRRGGQDEGASVLRVVVDQATLMATGAVYVVLGVVFVRSLKR